MIYEFFVKIVMIKVAPKETGIHDLLRKRWSARSFSEAMIGDNELMNVFQAASQDMYADANAGDAQQGASNDGGNPADEVTDVDFEEVEDKK